jgi:hypothetical protein
MAGNKIPASGLGILGFGGRKKWWTGGELNSRHRDFQSVHDDEEPVSPHPLQSCGRVKKAYDDLGFASERQLDMW